MKIYQKFNIGLIGAGAIAQHAYLPVLNSLSNISLNTIVDTNLDLIKDLSKKYELDYIGPDIDQGLKYVDAVIVAAPNFLHAPISIKCMEARKHVLCEKPMTISSESGHEMVDCARGNDVKLAVAHVRRFYPSSQSIRRIIKKKVFGNTVSFDCEEGVIFNWPTTSGFFFDREKAGGGVLMDIGVHLLDLLLWWMPYEINYVKYEDDNLGGVEAFAKIEIAFKNGITGSVKLSRLSILKNRYSIRCEKGTVEWDPFVPRKFYVQNFSTRSTRTIKAKKEMPVEGLLRDFILSIQSDRKPLVSGEEALKVIQLIERCYQSRTPLSLGWLQREGVAWK